jgi:uncharacterized protein (TIGR00369 family)
MTQAQPQDPTLSGWKPRSLEGFFGLVGPLWTRKEENAWAYGFVAEKKHTNQAAIVHGGMLATLVDHALSAIAWEANDRRPCITVQLDVHFLAAVRPGRLVEARGRVVRRTSTLFFMQGNLTVEGEEVAIASAVLKIVK